MGSSSPALSNMQFLVSFTLPNINSTQFRFHNLSAQVLLSAVALAFASPIPEEGAEAPEALAYVHDATGDVAVDDSPAALPYVHDATGDVADASSPAAEAYVHDVTGDVAEPYVHVEPVVAAPAAVAPVTYAAYPYAHAGYAGYPYAVAAYHTGCVNNVGSVVPCA